MKTVQTPTILDSLVSRAALGAAADGRTAMGRASLADATLFSDLVASAGWARREAPAVSERVAADRPRQDRSNRGQDRERVADDARRTREEPARPPERRSDASAEEGAEKRSEEKSLDRSREMAREAAEAAARGSGDAATPIAVPPASVAATPLGPWLDALSAIRAESAQATASEPAQPDDPAGGVPASTSPATAGDGGGDTAAIRPAGPDGASAPRNGAGAEPGGGAAAVTRMALDGAPGKALPADPTAGSPADVATLADGIHAATTPPGIGLSADTPDGAASSAAGAAAGLATGTGSTGSGRPGRKGADPAIDPGRLAAAKPAGVTGAEPDAAIRVPDPRTTSPAGPGRQTGASSVPEDAAGPAVSTADSAAAADAVRMSDVPTRPGSGSAAAAGTPVAGAAGDAGLFALTMNQAGVQGVGTGNRGDAVGNRGDAVGIGGQARIDVPVDHPDFSEALARQSVDFVIRGHDRAEIRLTPEDMGPIRIGISLDDDSASLDISAAHASTRAAIEASMPALRQMLADQGVRLAEWRLDAQTGADRSAGQGQGGNGQSGSGQNGSAGQGFGSGSNLQNGGDAAGLQQSGGQGAANGSHAGTDGRTARPTPETPAPDRSAPSGRRMALDAGLDGGANGSAPAGTRRIDLYA